MASVTVFSALRMLAIEAASIVGGAVNAGGDLILTKHDGGTVNAGHVAGPQGIQGIQGPSGTTFQRMDTLTSFAAASAPGIHVITNAQTDGPISATWFMCQTTQYQSETVWNQQEAWSPFGSVSGPDNRRWMRQMYGTNGDVWGPWREIGGVPAGCIMMAGGTTIPYGWLKCQGQAVSRTIYAALFAAIGTTHGVGDGSTTFNLPNIQGRVPLGANGSDVDFNAIGKTGGEKTHVLSIAETPSHAHTDAHTHTTPATDTGGQSANHHHSLPIANTQQSTSVSTGPNGYTVTTAPGTSGWNDASHTHALPAMTTNSQSSSSTGSIGSDGAHNNLQPYICFDYIIKT